jgi:hypothetical protein
MTLPSKRRWARWLLVILGTCMLLCAAAMLHPYPRQSLFGPTIRGRPRCVWEAELRRFGGPESLTDKVLSWLNIAPSGLMQGELFDHPDMLPLVLELLDEDDHNLRALAMSRIATYRSLQDRSALPALYRRYREDHIHNRLLAARAIWFIDRDPQVLAVMRELFADEDPGYRALGMSHAAIFADAPELFPDIVALAGDPNDRVRAPVMFAMRHYGATGVPILIKGLDDADTNVRLNVVWALALLGPQALEAVPALEAHLTDPDAQVRGEIRQALQAVDPQRQKTAKNPARIRQY